MHQIVLNTSERSWIMFFSRTLSPFMGNLWHQWDFVRCTRGGPVESPWILLETSCFNKTSFFPNPWRTRRIPVATRREPVEIYGFWTSRNRLKLEGKMILFSAKSRNSACQKRRQFSCFELPGWEKRMFQFLSLHIASCYTVSGMCSSKANINPWCCTITHWVLFLAVALRVTVDT